MHDETYKVGIVVDGRVCNCGNDSLGRNRSSGGETFYSVGQKGHCRNTQKD